MSFTSLEFIFIFFPLTLAGYYFANEKLKNIFLAAASLIFYSVGEPELFGVLVLSILVNWVFGFFWGKIREPGDRKKRFFCLRYCGISVCCSIINI